MMTKLVADSSCDVYTFDRVAFEAVPLTIATDTQSFRDDAGLNVPEMLETLREHKGRSYTACPNIGQWLEAYQGAEQVYAVTITSALSGSYNAAMAAREIYQQEHPETNIHVFDSLSTGPECLLLLEKLRELTEANLSFEDVVERMEAYQRKTRLFFSLHSLHNLAQNGRVSKVVAAAVGVMNIRVIGTASPEGTLSPIGKARGDKRAAAELVEQMEQAGYRGGKIRVTHVQNPELARSFEEFLRKDYPNADIQIHCAGGLCSYYAEKGSLMIGVETE